MLALAGWGRGLWGAREASGALGSRWQPATPTRVKNPMERHKRNRGVSFCILRVSSYHLGRFNPKLLNEMRFPWACGAEKKIHGLPALLTHRIVSGEGRVGTGSADCCSDC